MPVRLVAAMVFFHLILHPAAPKYAFHLFVIPYNYLYTVRSVVFVESVLPQLLHALCSGPETPLEHLERQQVTFSLI